MMTERRARADMARQRARAIKNGRVEVAIAPYLFVTPPPTAEYVVELAQIRPGMSVLEPSAGTGNLLENIPADCDVVAVEIDYKLCYFLRHRYPTIQVIQEDFLEYRDRYFDRIVMNPPFDHGLDIRHIQHAFSRLREGGRLVTICADGSKQREILKPISTLYEELEEGTFKQSGTMVRAAVVVMDR